MSAILTNISRRATLRGLGGLALISLPGRIFAAEDLLAKDIVALFEPGSKTSERKAIYDARLSPAGQRRWAFEEFDRVIGEIAEMSGGFELVASKNDGANLWLQVRLRNRSMVRSIRVRLDRDDAQKIFDIFTSPLPTPYDGPVIDGPVSASRLAAAIDQRIRFAVDRDEFSGAARIVAPDGEVVYERCFGWADRARKRAIHPDTQFNLGSAGKSFTALIAARLVQEGKLSWDARLSDILPDYPNRPFAEACTVRHLVTHSSGLRGLFDRPAWERRRPTARMSDLFYAFADAPPAFAPGTSGAYSNEGFVVLGAVVEAASGRSWYDLVKDWIYAPAGMKRSGDFLYQQLPTSAALGYRFDDRDHLGLNGRRVNDDFLGYRGNSCGGGYSTVRDMTTYLRALRAGKILPRALLDPMIEPARPGIRNYGIGFEVRPLGTRRLVGHGGGGPNSGIDGMNGIVWETGWAFSLLGNYDAPFAGAVATDIGVWLALQ